MTNKELHEFAIKNRFEKCHIIFTDGDEITSTLDGICYGHGGIIETVSFSVTGERELYASCIKSIEVKL
jgi:ribonucleotide monophosphatase NagD (HAD superfamily)